jgi:hypothetical protein
MNRAEAFREVLRLEAIAEACKNRAGKYRHELDTEAREELAAQGSAPTWRLPDLGTVALPLSKQAIVVDDIAALKKWVQANRPEEIVTTTEIRASYQTALFAAVVVTPDGVTFNGELVPGLTVKPGGVPQTLRFSPDRETKQVYALLGEHLLDKLLASTGPVEVLASVVSDAP